MILPKHYYLKKKTDRYLGKISYDEDHAPLNDLVELPRRSKRLKSEY